MPRRGITKNDVATAVASIEDRGEKPTIRSVRKVLGTGSASTISKYMAQLRIEAETGSEGIPDLPQDLELKFMTVFQEIWKSSNEIANQENVKLRAEMCNAGFTFGDIKDALSDLVGKVESYEEYFQDAAMPTKRNR